MPTCWHSGPVALEHGPDAGNLARSRRPTSPTLTALTPSPWRCAGRTAWPRQGCGSASVQIIATRKLWRCKECKRQFSVRVGSVFEDSPIPFTKWLPAFWLLSNTKNGTSSCELARAIGVTQKTAWFMFHRTREAMGTQTFAEMLTAYGPGKAVEVDETFVGGKLRNQHRGGERAACAVRAPAHTTRKRRSSARSNVAAKCARRSFPT